VEIGQIFRRIGKIEKRDYGIRHVRLSVCMEQNRLPLDGFSLNLVSEYFFRKSVEKIQVSLKSDKNNGYFT
jgi:hypothetical protein